MLKTMSEIDAYISNIEISPDPSWVKAMCYVVLQIMEDYSVAQPIQNEFYQLFSTGDIISNRDKILTFIKDPIKTIIKLRIG
jgi:hypothetical protein